MSLLSHLKGMPFTNYLINLDNVLQLIQFLLSA